MTLPSWQFCNPSDCIDRMRKEATKKEYIRKKKSAKHKKQVEQAKKGIR